MLILIFDTEEEKDKFVALYETYSKTIYYTLTRFQLDAYTIEDLSQDIYIKLAEHLDDIDMSNYKRTQNYIITITRNYCLNFLRGHNKKQEELSENIYGADDYTNSVEEYVINKEQIERLSKEISKLDDIYKSVLELKYVNGFKDEEIAAFLKIKKKTVEVRIYRAKKILREKMKE